MCGVVSYLVIEADRHPVDINNDGIRNGNTWTQCNEVVKRNKVNSTTVTAIIILHLSLSFEIY